jgi:DNA-binding CsgD family transcriptional regulator
MVTDRERRILAQYAETGSQSETAKALGLQTQTVKNALLDIRRKVGAQSSAQLLYMLGAGELDS